MIEKFRARDQVVYIPDHAEGDPYHKDSQWGFVTSVTPRFVFCRYFYREHVDPKMSLRTTGGSESTPPGLLIKMKTRDQEEINKLFCDLFWMGAKIPKHRIMFKDWKIRTILNKWDWGDGGYMQTRRILKPPKGLDPGAVTHWVKYDDTPGKFSKINSFWQPWGVSEILDSGEEIGAPLADPVKCKYGNLGHHLWVQETYATPSSYNHIKPSKLWENMGAPVITYRASEPYPTHYHWRSPLFMPERASRVTLEIVDLDIKRLQDITDDECLMEGIEDKGGYYWIPEMRESHHDAREPFSLLWDRIFKLKPGKQWDDNPWVYVITYNLQHVKGY